MKNIAITPLNLPELVNRAAFLPATGKLLRLENNLVYLAVNDQFINQLFPLIQNPAVKKPDYFGKGSTGAHISVIYPEENTVIDPEDLNREHGFSLNEMVIAELGQKKYYVLLVNAPSLLKLRKKYHLPELLCFKGYGITFHITIGYCINT